MALEKERKRMKDGGKTQYLKEEGSSLDGLRVSCCSTEGQTVRHYTGTDYNTHLHPHHAQNYCK